MERKHQEICVDETRTKGLDRGTESQGCFPGLGMCMRVRGTHCLRSGEGALRSAWGRPDAAPEPRPPSPALRLAALRAAPGL